MNFFLMKINELNYWSNYQKNVISENNSIQQNTVSGLSVFNLYCNVLVYVLV